MSLDRPYHKYLVHSDTEIKGFFHEYRYLSNYDATPVWFEGLFYPTVENAYQAAKCYLEHDRKRFTGISPAEAKKLGNILPLRDDWEDVKFDIMFELVFQKFLKHADRRRMLLETGDRYVEETNHWNDRIWGVCNGVGKNWLGIILMRVRTMLQPVESPKLRAIFKVREMTEADFLNWVSDEATEPWSSMASNMLCFGVNEGSLSALIKQFPVCLTSKK